MGGKFNWPTKIRKDEFGNPPVRYEAINLGMEKVAKKASELNASVHMPRIGCGLAGGKWEHIEPILQKNLSKENIEVVVYDFK
jgi:O-acetyl-ADP-ribose deacetylase (regulator of RNase III)